MRWLQEAWIPPEEDLAEDWGTDCEISAPGPYYKYLKYNLLAWSHLRMPSNYWPGTYGTLSTISFTPVLPPGILQMKIRINYAASNTAPKWALFREPGEECTPSPRNLIQMRPLTAASYNQWIDVHQQPGSYAYSCIRFSGLGSRGPAEFLGFAASLP